MLKLKFYVYTLADPRNGKVFYVGKGSGERLYAHAKEAKKCLTDKHFLITDILEAGLFIKYSVVERFKSEKEAFAAEARLINKIGIDNLTNIQPGTTDRNWETFKVLLDFIYKLKDFEWFKPTLKGRKRYKLYCDSLVDMTNRLHKEIGTKRFKEMEDKYFKYVLKNKKSLGGI